MTKVLLIAPHPDDAELGMGGVIVQMIQSNWNVVLADLTNGEPTPLGTEQIRKQESNEASRILGIKNRINLGLPNRYLQATLENRTRLAELIRTEHPDILFGPKSPDYHPDHIEATKLVDGARFAAKFHKTDMEGSPHWTPRVYQYYSPHRAQHSTPSFIVDISNVWEQKISAIQAYQSQIKNTAGRNTIALIDRIETICRYFGQCIGCKYGEPFVSQDPIAMNNLAILPQQEASLQS